MSEWKSVKLGELYEVHNGLSKGRKFFGSGYPFLSFSTVFNNYFIPNELTDLVQSTESERNSYSIQRGDIFVTRTSETSDELGMSCVALKDYPDATYNGFTKRMRPITDRVLPEYIGYYMRMPSFRGEFQAFSTMTTRASLKNEDLLSLSVSLPSLNEQNRIAQVLLNYDNLIENNQKQIKLLEEAAQRIYKEWFVDLRFPGYEDVHIVDGVPEGWRKCVISDICDTVGGGTPSTSRKEYYDGGTIPWVTPTDLTKDSSLILLDTEKHITEDGLNNSSAKILPSNTILMTSRASIGYFALCEQEVCTNQGFISCIPKHEYIRYYLLYNLMNRVEEIKGKATGSTFLEIAKRTFRDMGILIPSENILQGFSSYITPYIERMRAIRKQINHLNEARDRLLPKLMSGEIEL